MVVTARRGMYTRFGRVPGEPFAVWKKRALKEHLAGLDIGMDHHLIGLRERQHRLPGIKSQWQVLRGSSGKPAHFAAWGRVPHRYRSAHAGLASQRPSPLTASDCTGWSCAGHWRSSPARWFQAIHHPIGSARHQCPGSA